MSVYRSAEISRCGETSMNVLVVGSGGREHALCWHLSASPLLGALWCAPGNAGIANEATCVPLDPMDFDGAGLVLPRKKRSTWW